MASSKILFLKLFWLLDSENPVYVETKINIPITPFALCFGNEASLKHGLCIGEMQLKNVTACLQIHADSKGVFGLFRCTFRENMEIFGINA